MAESPQVTPFIPPLPGPAGGASPLRPPVIPPTGPNDPPPWATYPQTPSHYPTNYPGTPYTGTPFIPPMNMMQTPGPPPGSYFPPPVNLPSAPPLQNAHGYSSDYTGYPTLGGPGGPGGHTPWPQAPVIPNATPFLHPSAFPGHPNAGGHNMPPPPMGVPPGVGWNMPAGGHPGGYTPGHAMHAPMGGPPPGWGPPMGAAPVTPGYPYGGYGAAPPGWPQTPAFSGAPLAEQGAGGSFASRWTGSRDHWDKVNPFAEGEQYGPVLEPFLVKAVRTHLKLNPLLAPAPPVEDEDRDHLLWDMLFPNNHCRRSTGDPRNRSWIKGRNEPATFPRVTHLRIVSRAFPWMINIRARNRIIGVTCGEVIDGVDDYLHNYVPKGELKSVGKRQLEQIYKSYHYNRSSVDGVPGGRLGDGLKRCDWLCNETLYGGLVVDDSFVRAHCGDALPCTVELKCMSRYNLSESEIASLHEMEHDEHEEHRSSGSRSRGSRSRATSSAGRSSGRSSGRSGE